jgi:antitoxin (DNA-binding transcriptional repressor) of toxin-antitoxin stability system
VKIETLRDVKANLSKIVKKLPVDRSVVTTKNGRPCAVLFPVTEETDIESMVLAQNKELLQLWIGPTKRESKKALPSWKTCLIRVSRSAE